MKGSLVLFWCIYVNIIAILCQHQSSISLTIMSKIHTHKHLPRTLRYTQLAFLSGSQCEIVLSSFIRVINVPQKGKKILLHLYRIFKLSWEMSAESLLNFSLFYRYIFKISFEWFFLCFSVSSSVKSLHNICWKVALINVMFCFQVVKGINHCRMIESDCKSLNSLNIVQQQQPGVGSGQHSRQASISSQLSGVKLRFNYLV